MKKMLFSLVAFMTMTLCVSCGQSNKETYMIQWLNYDGTVLEIDKNVEKGTMPEYNGETPVKPSDEKYNYIFLNWYTVPMPVEKDASYTAQFRTVDKSSNVLGIDSGDIENLAYKGGKYLIENYVPGGSIITTALDYLFFKPKEETDPGPTLSDISDKLDDLRDTVDTQFKKVEQEISDLAAQQAAMGVAIENRINALGAKLEADIANQTVFASKANSFDTLLASFQDAETQLHSIHKDKTLSDQSKAVQIANLIGPNGNWTQSDNLYNQYRSFLNTITGTAVGDLQGRDYLQVIYDTFFSTEYMFSGEVIDRASMYVDKLVYLALEAFSVCSECLNAAATVSSFTNDDKAKLDDQSKTLYESGKVTSLLSIIESEIAFLNSKVFEVGYDKVSFADRMQSFYTKDRDLLIYHITTKPLPKLGRTMYYYKLQIVDGINNYEGDYPDGEAAFQAFESHVWPLESWNINMYGKDMALTDAFYSYFTSTYPGKTYRDYLTTIGFDVSKYSSNALFVTHTSFGYQTRDHDGYPDVFNVGSVTGVFLDDPICAKHDADVVTYTIVGNYRLDKEVEMITLGSQYDQPLKHSVI